MSNVFDRIRRFATLGRTVLVLVAVVRPNTQVKLVAFWALTVPILAIGSLVLALRAAARRGRPRTGTAATG